MVPWGENLKVMFILSLQSSNLSEDCVGLAWEEDTWYKFKYILPKLLIVFWIIIEHFHQERWIVKFQVTQPIASLIINKCFQLLPLLGHWCYRLVSIPIHPWLLSFLFLEKPLGWTLLGRALASIETSSLILCPLKPCLITSQIARAEKEFPLTQLSWNSPIK